MYFDDDGNGALSADELSTVRATGKCFMGAVVFFSWRLMGFEGDLNGILRFQEIGILR